MKACHAPVMTLDETTKNIAGEGKSPAVKIEPGSNNRLIIRNQYNQNLIKKVKSIPKRKYWEVPYDENLISRIHVSTKNLPAIKNALDRLLTGDRT